MKFLNGKYSLYSVSGGVHYYGAGALDDSEIQYESNQWGATFYEVSDSNVLNKYKQLTFGFFVGEDTGMVIEEIPEELAKAENMVVRNPQLRSYNPYYYPEKTIRNTYEVKIDYSGEIILDESKEYLGDDSNGNIGRIYYVDCTTGEIIGGRNYGSLDVTIEGEYMENGESRMATKNIFYDVVTREKVAERNFNYSQEVIDEFMKKN